LETLKGRDHSGVDGRIVLKWVLGKFSGEEVWTGYIWLRIGASGALL
jgi:hypothetical protein